MFLPDVPGFSDASQPWAFHYSLSAITEVLASAFDRLGLARFHVVGNSLGGAIAAQYALTHPERVRTLTLIGAAGVEMPIPSKLKEMMDDGINPFVVQTYEQWAEFIQMVLERPPPMPAVVRRHMARVFIGRAALNSKIMDDLLEQDFDFSRSGCPRSGPPRSRSTRQARPAHPSVLRARLSRGDPALAPGLPPRDRALPPRSRPRRSRLASYGSSSTKRKCDPRHGSLCGVAGVGIVGLPWMHYRSAFGTQRPDRRTTNP